MEILRVRIPRFLALIPVLTATLWAADPTIGTWTLNVQRSRFVPGPPFRSETRSYEEQKDGVKVTIRTVDGKGRQVTSVYLTTADGQRHTVSGSGGGPADAVALKRIDDFTAESALLHAGKEIAKTTRTVSRDGKSMTITYKGHDPDGNPVAYTLFFVKSKP
jgi:acyl-coenzyme A thioesterase PaaI-like protein